jgi:hypothetical protein
MWTMLVARSPRVSTGVLTQVHVASWLVFSSHSKELKDLKTKKLKFSYETI